MAIGLYYTMEFTNVENVFVKVLIGDTTVEAEVPQIIPLDPAGDPLRISTIDNEENKFSPIKGQQAAITFHSNSETSLLTFADGPDDRFPVTILYGTTIIFYGFLSLADNQEAFLPPRNEVTLIANDKLGALKDIPLTDFGGSVVGVNPEGKYTIGQLVAMCLQKTGLSLQLRVINNLRHGAGAITTFVTFSASGQYIIVAADLFNFFYAGQEIIVTDSVSNNITYHVTSVVLASGPVTQIFVSETIATGEATVGVTLTDTSTAEHFYNTFLDAKTFEEEIGVSENCYDVLSKILGYDCFIVQYKECWWICRVDEYEDNPFYVARFDENGEFLDIYEETNLSKNIGKDEIHWFEGEATVILPTRPIGFGKLTYNFEYPAEIVCNQDFDRGEVIIEPVLSLPNSEGAYNLDCWTKQKFPTSGTTIIPADNDAYIKRVFEYGYEKEKYIVLTTGPAAANEGVMSQPFPIQVKDKIDVSVDWRLSGNVGGGDTGANVKAFNVLIISDAGQYYYLDYTVGGGGNASWAGPFSGQRNQAVNYLWDPSTTDETEWQTLSVTAPPAPVSGMLYIGLFKEWQGSGVYEVDTYFSNLQLNITPFVNGSYRLYKGRYDKVEREAEGYLAKVEDEVFMSDAERELFKGAMFFIADSVYWLTVKWHNAARYALGSPTDLTVVKPFGWIQAYSVWNQYRLSNRIFQTQMQGFGSDVPSLVHKYTITDVSGHSVSRYFLMLTCEKDLSKCNMTGTIEQVYHTVEGKSYDDPHEFKYIS